MHITYSETCVNVNDGNAQVGQLLKNLQHSLISREVSDIAVAFIFVAQLEFMCSVYTCRTLQYDLGNCTYCYYNVSIPQ